jgi:nucleotide-binding universal stress UspA family protein
MHYKILIPVDGSERALAAVRHALELVGHGLKARFVLVNVQEPANFYEMVVARDPQVLQRVVEAAGRDQLQAAQALLQAAGQAVECVVATGDPTQVILEQCEAHGCRAIMLSARGAGALPSVFMGSVSQAVLRGAPVPVTVVHAGADEAPS